jgi:hypothetical protein
MKHIEDQHQAALISWANMQPELRGHILAIANGGKRNIREAARLKKTGVLKGVSDIFIAVRRGVFGGMWLELKAPKPDGRAPSKDQVLFQDRMREGGYHTAVAYGWIEAKEMIEAYLALDHTI